MQPSSARECKFLRWYDSFGCDGLRHDDGECRQFAAVQIGRDERARHLSPRLQILAVMVWKLSEECVSGALRVVVWALRLDGPFADERFELVAKQVLRIEQSVESRTGSI